jgi:hypothetical protein
MQPSEDDRAAAATADDTAMPAVEPDEDEVGRIVDEVEDDIRHGHVEDDVSHVLEERLGEAGVRLRPETVDDIAEDIENDVSL